MSTIRKSVKINRVSIYLNGTASVSGEVDLGAEGTAPVTMSVPKKYRNDVLTSLCVGGEGITLKQPPTMKHPENPSEPRLTLNPSAIVESIAESLSGARIAINGDALSGTLVGLDTDGSDEANRRLVILTDDGQQKFYDLKNIESYTFPDEKIAAQVARALTRNIDEINPASAPIDFEVEGNANGKAAVLYVQGSAPWTMSYRLFADGENIKLQGLAHIHNITAEDWEDVEVTVSTANPIDFEPLVADPKEVRRQTVDLAPDQASGPRSVAKAARAMSARSMGGFESAAMDDESALEGLGAAPMMAASFSGGNSAFDPAATANAIGDFVEYTSNRPVNLPAGTNINVPVLDVTLDDGDVVLHYDPAKGGNAFQSLWFTNETGQPLRNGAAAVYLDGRFSGRCVVPAAQVSEELILPFKEENRVTFDQGNEHRAPKIIRVSVADGVIISEEKHTDIKTYTVKNVSGESFEVVIDHQRRFSGKGSDLSIDGVEEYDTYDAAGLKRIAFTLEGNETLTITVEETFVNQTNITIVNNPDHAGRWLTSNFLSLDGADVDDPKLQRYIELQKQIDDTRKALQGEQRKVAKLQESIVLYRDNLAAVGEGTPQKSEWVDKLSTCTTDFETSQAETEKLNGTLVDLSDEQKSVLTGLQFVWNAE